MTLPHPSGDSHWTRREPNRILRGVDAPGAKLSQAQITELCERHSSGETMPSLAREYGVSRITIWRHIKARREV